MERLAVADLEALLRLPSGLDDLAEQTLVEVRAGGTASPDLAQRLVGVPAVLVAAADAPPEVLEAVDVVGDREDRDALDQAVRANPHAAVALAVLTRGRARRSLLDDLVAESATYSLLQSGPEHRAWLAGRPRPRARPAGSGPAVVVERDGDLLRVLLDRPEVRNAFGVAVRDGLLDALAVAAADPSLTVELAGAGPAFCSGGDLTEFGTVPDPASAHVIRLRRSVGRALSLVSARTTVVVHGPCVGAGVELPAFAGRVVARPDATFCLPEVSMGLVPGAGGTASLPRRVGRHRFLLLALTGRRIDAPAALAWGLVDEIDAGRTR